MVAELDAALTKAQVARLAVLRGFPASEAARAEIAKALKVWCVGVRLNDKGKRCGPNQQCEAVIDKAVLTLTGWNAPAQLRDVYDDLFPPYGRKGEINDLS